MDEISVSYDSKALDHHGIIAALLDEIGLPARVDSFIQKKSNNHQVSHGQVVKAMILQGLGFSNQRLYLAKHFFEKTAVGDLFSEGVESGHFTADVLSATLDKISEYGPDRFVLDTCMSILSSSGLSKKMLYLDTTSISVKGRAYKGNSCYSPFQLVQDRATSAHHN